MRDRIELRIDPAERESWEQAAKENGLTLSEYVRTTVNQSVRTKPETYVQNVEPVRTKSKSVRTKEQNVRTESKDSGTESPELVRTVEPGRMEKPAKKPVVSNQVCRALGHFYIVDSDRMICARCNHPK
jgi:antitoxin component of RelBE/YafQ-DinJ toxin-antitoxin module